MKYQPLVIDANKPFQFIAVQDCGEACCPHCGADGRYIYQWAEYGEIKGAMAGCYAALTGRIKKDDVTTHIERISVKQAKNKPLNGWDKTIIRMLEYINSNTDSGKIAWANRNIENAVSDAKSYSFRKFH
jgi:hypothetical protein